MDSCCNIFWRLQDNPIFVSNLGYSRPKEVEVLLPSNLVEAVLIGSFIGEAIDLVDFANSFM